MRFCLPAALTLFLGFTVNLSADARLDGYNPVDLSDWQPRTAPSAMALVEPIYRDHPYRLEGRPTLKIDLRKDGPGWLAVDITLRGFLDDSVDGEEYRGFISRSDTGWRLDVLGKRNICARGANAGIPTVELCP